MVGRCAPPRHWNDQLEEGEDNHRRPEILCRHPTNGQWYVIDVTVAWGGGGRWGVDYCKSGAAIAHAKHVYPAGIDSGQSAKWTCTQLAVNHSWILLRLDDYLNHLFGQHENAMTALR